MEDKVNLVHATVEIVYGERPPNFDKIKAVFPLVEELPGVIYAYGDKIFVPSGKEIPPEILAHERIHCERQIKMGVETWWDQYLVDLKFRFDEELLAHKVEYSFLRGLYPGAHRKKSILEHVATKLSHPLYGGMVSKKRAMEVIKR